MSIGFVFPGQGAQEVGMLADVRDAEPIFQARLAAASGVLGFDLADIIASGPAERLNATEITQPAMLAVSVALYEVWCERGGATPSAVAGHSLGEYSALTAAGALRFEDAVRLVHERGKLMQQAVPAGQGAMAAIIGLEDEQIAAVCESTQGVVTPANLNAPGQVVIAGAAEAVDLAIEGCAEAGAKRAIKLEVSVPSHCALMEPAAVGVAKLLEEVELKTPNIPVVHNVDAQVAGDTAGIRDRLIRQLSSPVRWTSCVQTMAGLGVSSVVECGPGKVLTGLMRRIDKSIGANAIGGAKALEAALEELS